MTCDLSFSSWCFENNSLYYFGNCSSPAVSSSPHIFFILCVSPSGDLNSVLNSSALLSCALPYVSPNATIVVCVRNAWIADASRWYTGIPAVFICSGGICWWFGGLCWGPVGIGHCCPYIPMYRVGKIWLDRGCYHRLVSRVGIPKNCDWGKKGLA